METVLYKQEEDGEFTGIYAHLEDGELTIVQQDMGEFEREYSRDGEVESYVFFDTSNTRQLLTLLGVDDESQLFNALKRKFKKHGSEIKTAICFFCDEHDITYQEEVRY